MSDGNLTLAERLRVAAALEPDGFTVELSREAALTLVKMLEDWDRVARADQWVHGLLADRAAWFQRREREYQQQLGRCLTIAMHTYILSWCIAELLR